MQHYELLIVLPGTLTENEVEPELEKVTTAVENTGAEDINTRNLGKVRMAYPMDGIEYGYYYNLQYQADPSEIPDLQQELSKNNNLLRSIITKYDPEKRDEEVEKVEVIQSREDIMDMIHGDDEEQEDQSSKKEKKQESKDEDESTDSGEKKETEEKKTKEPTKEESSESEKKEEQDDQDEDDEDISLEEIDDKLDDILDDEDIDV